ncbi:6-phosphogluconate dehydrogenase [Sphingomonas sp. Leaf357]|uniref:NAD(P)-dependent oxidoreductase n=1 Tax=Sphingomonas sp. Leaf357 TaxID=1736350 RepID=UPI0006FD50E1|nr:NAD(P)-dependent oxidoreductase [Sphingomonas sp. Leaf357]KQS03873.1 6-phosphogluconate dehydrogenase [Sphingomonas sp. Leaf357]
MADKDPALAFIGFGEAGAAFASGIGIAAIAYDCANKAEACRSHGVAFATSNAAAVQNAGLILSVVTADQALAAARETARGIVRDALYCDCNSVAPDTKRAARDAIEAAGGRYVDVAVMAPVHPAGRGVPLLVSGAHAEAGAAALQAAGFAKVRVVPGEVGRASSIKMIRSVMVKGLEALTAECVLAADRAGVLGEVLDSLDASPPPPDWHSRADYNLERMMAHGLRRAAEMEEVVKTLDALGTGSAMTRGTVVRQRAIGALTIAAPATLNQKLAALARSEAAPKRRNFA